MYLQRQYALRQRRALEGDAADELLGLHVDDEAPERLARCLGEGVPERIDHGRECEVDDPLFGTGPAR